MGLCSYTFLFAVEITRFCLGALFVVVILQTGNSYSYPPVIFYCLVLGLNFNSLHVYTMARYTKISTFLNFWEVKYFEIEIQGVNSTHFR